MSIPPERYDGCLHLSSERELVVAVWTAAPSGVESLNRIEAAGRRRPRPALLNVVLGGVPAFSDEFRSKVSEMAMLRLFTRGVAHVILVPGFVGSAVRSFLSNAILLNRGGPSIKIFDRLEPATSWLLTHLEPSWTEEHVNALCGTAIAEATAAAGIKL